VPDHLLDKGLESRANAFLNYIGMLFNWSVGRDSIDASPTDRIKPPGAEKSRD